LKWTRCIHQESRIGQKIEGGRDRHVRVILRNIEDKNMILRNRGLLRGTHIYLDEDLTFSQQEQQRKEWEKVKTTRSEGKWAWLKNAKAQISDRFSNKKYEIGAPQDCLQVISWNCRGYPWRRGPGLGSTTEGKYIIILVETHEYDGCKVPDFEGYKKTSVWNKGNETSKGHKGVTVLINEKWCGVVKVVKENPNKQYIWLQITEKEVTFRLVACYFSPQKTQRSIKDAI
jgi:hypothetical protein